MLKILDERKNPALYSENTEGVKATKKGTAKVPKSVKKAVGGGKASAVIESPKNDNSEDGDNWNGDKTANDVPENVSG